MNFKKKRNKPLQAKEGYGRSPETREGRGGIRNAPQKEVWGDRKCQKIVFPRGSIFTFNDKGLLVRDFIGEQLRLNQAFSRKMDENFRDFLMKRFSQAVFAGKKERILHLRNWKKYLGKGEKKDRGQWPASVRLVMDKHPSPPVFIKLKLPLTKIPKEIDVFTKKRLALVDRQSAISPSFFRRDPHRRLEVLCPGK